MFTPTRNRRVKRVIGVLLTSLLLAGLLATLFPLETLATAQICNLACCAGRAPHAAGSCMDGSCNAAPNKHSRRIRSSRRKEITDELCGAAAFTRKVASRKNRGTPQVWSLKDQSASTQLSSATITKPCRPDCGRCASGFASASFRNRAVTSGGEHWRTPAGPGPGRTSFAQLLTLKTLIRQSAPRGPPSTLS